MTRFFHDRNGGGEVTAGVRRLNPAETDNSYDVTVDLPRLKPKEVEIEHRHGDLWITGQRKTEFEEKRKTWHRIACSQGEFRRIIRLGDDTPGASARIARTACCTSRFPSLNTPARRRSRSIRARRLFSSISVVKELPRTHNRTRQANRRSPLRHRHRQPDFPLAWFQHVDPFLHFCQFALAFLCLRFALLWNARSFNSASH